MKNNFSAPEFKLPEVESGSIEALSLKLIQTTTELSKKNEALAKSERERKEMLANISHDLRAPITAIRSSLDLLDSYEEITKEELSNTLGLIDRRVATLESLIQDMYFLFSVEDDNRKFECEKVEVIPFLESYFYDAIIDSRYDNHDMQLDLPMLSGIYVNIDIQKTIRVLDNLFTNAAKYSGEGSQILLSGKFPEAGHSIEISVSDNGVGIPAESVERIFERTYTVSSARTPGKETGSGLGLSIVKAVIEKQGGSVRCESELGKGTIFTITLPTV